MGSLEGRVIVETGAGGGISRATFIGQCAASDPLERRGGWIIESIAEEVVARFRPRFGELRSEHQSIITSSKLA